MLTSEELEKRLDMIKYYDLSNQMWQEHIDRVADGDSSPLPALMAEAGKEAIQRNNELKAEVVRLLDYTTNDTDKEVLYRYYVKHQDYFDIAEDMYYSYSYINSKKADAFHKLAERLANHPAIPF